MMGSAWTRLRLGRCLTATMLVAGRLADAAGYELDINSKDSVHKVAKGVADDMLSFYTGNKPGGTPGILPQGYFWWETGAMFNALIDYWLYTGDSSYNDLVTQGLLFQVGDQNDYMPSNQTLTEGNDDQGFWGLAVMSAAENNFPNPPADKPQWLALAQAVFNTQAARWDTEYCNGGLRWQIYKWNRGYDYKNSISQACFFALGARLALFTGNQSYADWADKTWDWMWDTGLINNETYYIIDGADTGSSCKNFTPYQFTYNAGGFILGASAMYNFTESKKWKDRVQGLVKGTEVFFVGENNDIMSEVACEPSRCNLDQQSFKAYLSRWLAAATKWAPDTYNTIIPYLKASAVAAVNQCVGGNNGRMCGMKWVRNDGKYDGTTGIGQQMAVLETLLATTIKDRAAPLTANTGGTSKGDAGAGSSDIGKTDPLPSFGPMSAGAKAGGAFLTLGILLGIVTAVGWLLLDETSDKKMIPQLKGSIANMKASITGKSIGKGPIIGVGARTNGADSPNVAEKTIQQTTGSASDDASGLSDRPVEDMSVTIGNVRSNEGNTSRRNSNMPLGWPRNSVSRPGLLGQAVSTDDADEITPAADNVAH